MKKKTQRPPLLETIKSWFAQPAADFYRRPAVYIYGGQTELQGCRAVLELEENRILVDMGRRKLALYGDGLVLSALNGRVLLVRGTLLKAEFLSGEGTT